MRLRTWLLGVVAVCASLAGPAPAQQVDPGVVVQTILTSTFGPASPDPTGITYLPATGELLTCDSEVDEMSIYAGVNLWTHSRTGVVSGTASTSAFSNEPSGVAADPAGGRLWISDDNSARIYEVDFGADGSFGTADDFVSDLDGLVGAGCDDFKDVTYDGENDRLFVVSRAGLEICEIVPGPNGVFDGAAPTGDDGVTTMSLIGTPITAPEGIVYDPLSRVGGSLVVADKGTRDLYELEPAGGLLRRIDVDFPAGVRPSGVTIAPGSANPVLRNYYVTDRGVDNNVDPLENDGRVFEVVALPLLGNAAPGVEAGPAQAIEWPANVVSLAGDVSDDGHPYPPSAVTLTWSLSSGPGNVTFGSPDSLATTASFSAPGSYVLQLLADDSALSTTDTVTIHVTQRFTLSVSSVGPGNVTLDPPGGVYAEGTSVSVNATPDPDSAFLGWSGALSGGANPETVVVSAHTSATATFATLYDVSTSVTGPGSLALDPPGGSYPAGTLVSVSATPEPGAIFDGFGGDLSDGATPQLLTVDADKAISASFSPEGYTLSVTSSGSGTVTLDPPGGVYPLGSMITLTAAPAAGFFFGGWSEDASGTTNPVTIEMDGPHAVHAEFKSAGGAGTSCGVGPELVALLAPLGWMLRRRRQRG